MTKILTLLTFIDWCAIGSERLFQRSTIVIDNFSIRVLV